MHSLFLPLRFLHIITPPLTARAPLAVGPVGTLRGPVALCPLAESHARCRSRWLSGLAGWARTACGPSTLDFPRGALVAVILTEREARLAIPWTHSPRWRLGGRALGAGCAAAPTTLLLPRSRSMLPSSAPLGAHGIDSVFLLAHLLLLLRGLLLYLLLLYLLLDFFAGAHSQPLVHVARSWEVSWEEHTCRCMGNQQGHTRDPHPTQQLLTEARRSSRRGCSMCPCPYP